MVEAQAAAADKDPLDYAHYRVLRRPDGMPWRLGAGSMGVTFKAVDRRLKTLVALKLIQPFRDLDAKVIQLFVREARAAARILHPNVAPVLFLSDAPGRLFYAMEFVDGVSLHDWLQANGPMEAASALAFARQICAGLVAIHAQQIVHRDLKPGNIMVVEFPPGHPRFEAQSDSGGCLLKIIDFGLARAFDEDLTASRAAPLTTGFHGTVIYASPEQCREERNLDGRSDIYSFGCILWELLCGRPPLEGETHFEQLNLHLTAPLPFEKLGPQPASLLQLLERCLAKSPADRFADAHELGRALEECSREVEQGTKIVQRRSTRSRQTWAWVAGAALLLAAAAGGFAFLTRTKPPASPVPAAISPSRRAEAERLFRQGYEVEHNFERGTPDYVRAAELYQQALAVDPQYAEAAARSAISQAQAYWQGLDRSPARLQSARQAAELAARLGPDLAITRLALGDLLYRAQNDFVRALREFERAAELEPENAEAWYFAALAARRLGRWDTATSHFARSLQLDPGSERNRSEYVTTLLDRRQWPEVLVQTQRDGVPLPTLVTERAYAEAHLAGSWDPIVADARQMDPRLEAEIAIYYKERAGLWQDVVRLAATARRRPSADMPRRGEVGLAEGLAHYALGETHAASRCFDALVKELEPALLDDPREGENWIKAAIALAGLGRAEEASAAAERGMKMMTVDRDAVRGPAALTDSAFAYSLAGNYARARELLEKSLNHPGEISVLALKAGPKWRWLRQDPAFSEWIAKK